MERATIFDIAHRRHPVAAPVSRDRLRELLSWITPPKQARAVDLGCGEGEWLQELLLANQDMSGVGVDHMLPSTAAEWSAQRELGSRIRWVEADASQWDDGLFDVVLCVGATHAFDCLQGTLAAIRRMLRPGGQVVLGDSIWEHEPSDAALAELDVTANAFLYLAGLVRAVQDADFEPTFAHVSTVAEWDDYQFCWSASLVNWAVTEARSDRDRDEALAVAREHRRSYLDGWRNQCGFATLALRDVRGLV